MISYNTNNLTFCSEFLAIFVVPLLNAHIPSVDPKGYDTYCKSYARSYAHKTAGGYANQLNAPLM